MICQNIDFCENNNNNNNNNNNYGGYLKRISVLAKKIA